ncbi:hypothetical protein KY343_03570 [Candidatus Woesearchaeota archaeon]|nr:hypothetical protein [Candidatus Woesearchaeota archaeon]
MIYSNDYYGKIKDYYKMLFNNLRSKIVKTDIRNKNLYIVLGNKGFGWRYYYESSGEPIGNVSYLISYSLDRSYNDLKKYQKELNPYLRTEEKRKLRLWLNIVEKYVKAKKKKDLQIQSFEDKLQDSFNKKIAKVIDEAEETLKRYICMEKL